MKPSPEPSSPTPSPQELGEILYLMDYVPWFGSHSGYERLPDYVLKQDVPLRLYRPQSGLLPRALGKAFSLWRGHGRTSQQHAFVRGQVEWAMKANRNRRAHLLYGEWHLGFWRDVSPSIMERSVLTLHQPLPTWSEHQTNSLSASRHLIVLWQKDIELLQSRAPQSKFTFIRHGVDIDFFHPSNVELPSSPKIHLLYAGVHLRNPRMLTKVIQILGHQRSDLHFDLLVPLHRRSDPDLRELLTHPQVTWHANLTDEQLRNLYRQSYLMLLPMNDSGANTAVIEALSCGLPIVTTDVGGIRDYGGGTVFPIVPNDDVDGMIALTEQYLQQPGWRKEIHLECRRFAEEQLAWPLITRQHLEVYRQLTV